VPVIRPDITPQLGEIPEGQPVAVPTPQPTEALNAAQRLIHNGDYGAALGAFQALTTDPTAPPEVTAEAHFGLGQAALQQGSFAAAQAAFDNFLAAYPTHENAAHATFMRGEAKLGVSDWSGAIADFQAYLTLRPGLADSYVYERIGDAHVALGQPVEAIAAYDQAVIAGRDISSLVALRERVAQVHLNTGNPQGAIDQYQAILNVAQIPFYRAKIEYLLSQAYLAAGDTASAEQHYVILINNYPDTRDAYSALQALDAAGASAVLDPFQRGLIEYTAEDYNASSESFYNWLALADPEHPADAHFYLARSWSGLGNPDAALSQYETVIVTHPDDPMWGQAYLEYAGVQVLASNTPGALETLNNFVGENPDLPQVPDALYQAAQLSAGTGDTERATDYYIRLAAASPGDERASEGLLLAGMDSFREGDYATAERILSVIVPNAQGDQLAAANLWLGRTYVGQGRLDEAANAFANAAAADPGGYYSIRATDLQSNGIPFQPPVSAHFQFDEATERAEAEAWLVNTFGLEDTPPLSGLRPDLAADGRVLRGQELWALGLWEEARIEFESAYDDYSDDPLAVYQFSLFFRDLGLYRPSINAARSLIVLSGQSSLTVPPFIARLHYPAYYNDLIVPAAEKYGLDPLLVLAIIRQESRFEGFVTSSAYAQGLMQIIPTTGEDIASRLSWPDYQNEDLYRPYVSVEFGTYYLDQQRDAFEGDLFAAMAAYNAGAGRVINWREQAGGDLDVFVEIIPFDETYRYVTFTYAQYAIYRELYSADG
jgi:soluble lytic murein transglycosylase